MAFTLTTGEIAVANRLATDKENVAAAIIDTLTILEGVAKAIILDYAAGAPDAVHDGALVRLVGYLYYADAEEGRGTQNPLHASGASSLLSYWRVHRAGVVASDGTVPAGEIVPPGSGLPPLPDNGSFILISLDGRLEWLHFPVPESPS